MLRVQQVVSATVIMPSGVNSNPVWLIVGGSRGIGLELVKQVSHSDPPAFVDADSERN